MKIVLATPLYPPDIAEPAPYIKELATRLKRNSPVTIVTYGRLPEKIEGVQIVSVDKRRPLPVRLFLYTVALLRAVKYADVIYAQNGPSVELPVSIVSLFFRKRLILHMGDLAAHEYAKKHFWRHLIEQIAVRHAKSVLFDSPLARPEILPFEPYPEKAFAEYDISWERHLEGLSKIFLHA